GKRVRLGGAADVDAVGSRAVLVEGGSRLAGDVEDDVAEQGGRAQVDGDGERGVADDVVRDPQGDRAVGGQVARDLGVGVGGSGHRVGDARDLLGGGVLEDDGVDRFAVEDGEAGGRGAGGVGAAARVEADCRA